MTMPVIQAQQGVVLIVDDNEANREMLSRRLQRRGYVTVTAARGAQALDLISKQHFDLVLLDVMMPDVDGFTVLQQVRAQRSMAELPIVLVTVKDQRDDIIRGLELGANDYLTKPLDFAVVMARIHTQLALKRAATELQPLVGAAKQAVISYSSKDQQAAEQVCKLLEQHHIGCWISSRDVPPGKHYAEEIVEAIDSGRAVVLLLSSNANASVHVRNEVEYAISHQKALFPVRIEPVEPSKALKLYLGTSQRIDAWVSLDQQIEKLAAAIRLL